MKLQRLDCFSWVLFLAPALLFFHVCGRGQVLIKVPGSSKSCNKLDAAERCSEYSPPCCASSSLEAGSDVVLGFHQNSSAPLHLVLLLIFCSPGFEPSATLSLSLLWQDGVRCLHSTLPSSCGCSFGRNHIGSSQLRQPLLHPTCPEMSAQGKDS